MARSCKVVGVILCVLGVMIGLVFGIGIARDGEGYRRAAEAARSAPADTVTQVQLQNAEIRRAFEAVGVIVGILLVINGSTLLGLGTLAQRVPRKKRKPPRVEPS